MASILFWFIVAVIALMLLAVLWNGLKVIVIVGMIAAASVAVYKALNLGRLDKI